MVMSCCLPDMFYRARARYEPLGSEGRVSSRVAMGDIRKALGPSVRIDRQPARGAGHAPRSSAYLDTRADVLGDEGRHDRLLHGRSDVARRAAPGPYPDRIAAAASFHGGNLAADTPMSPHLLAPKMKGFVYVAGADKDNSYPPEMHARARDRTLTDAGVPHRCEIYPGALHGWTMADFPIYKEDDAERHFRELRRAVRGVAALSEASESLDPTLPTRRSAP